MTKDEERAAIADEESANKEALVDRYGGWKHRRWEVLYNMPQDAAMARFCAETGLRQSRRGGDSMLYAIARKPKQPTYERYYGRYGQHPAYPDLNRHGLIDHPRTFSVPGRKGAQAGVLLLQPYNPVERLANDIRPRANHEMLPDTLANHGLSMRIIAHTPYNQGTIGVLLFATWDHDVYRMLEETQDYIFPG